MKTALMRQVPEVGMIGPNWCHHHGSKMRLKELNLGNYILFLEASAAWVVVKLDVAREGWVVQWEVVHSPKSKVEGTVFMTTDQLKAAFGLSDESGEHGDSLITRYGGDSAEQGKWIRWRDFLNIPCPGTGHDGDPNISIHLDKEIRNAVHQLVHHPR